MQKKITISVSPVGETKIEAEGFQGQSCTLATKSLQDALMGDEASVTLKDEFYQEEVEHERLHESE